MTRVLIIGGGIAGPAAAIALHKAGISATICEGRPADAASAGAFLTVSANGQDALRAIDAYKPVADESFPAHRIKVFGPGGNQLADIPLGGGHDCPRTLTRAALSSTLLAHAASLGVPVEYGRKLATASAGPGGQVTAVFTDGSTAEADLLIGADGIRSAVRTLIDRAAPAPRYTGLMIACGYATDPPATADPDTYHMIYGSTAFFGHTRAPCGQAWWFARIPGPENTPGQAPASDWKERAATAFDPDDTPAAVIIRATDEPITVTSAYAIPSLPAWHDGTAMVLIGDAAHAASPSTAQGASQAIEDAVTLARCLRDHREIPHALDTYEKLRRDRAERVVRSGADGTNPAPPDPARQAPRDPSATDWLLGHHINWDQPAHHDT